MGINPRRNKIRILFSLILSTIPLLVLGEYVVFWKSFIVLTISAWFFAAYPIQGWSHSAFHLVIALIPPILLPAAANLHASHDATSLALSCALEKVPLY